MSDENQAAPTVPVRDYNDLYRRHLETKRELEDVSKAGAAAAERLQDALAQLNRLQKLEAKLERIALAIVFSAGYSKSQCDLPQDQVSDALDAVNKFRAHIP